MNVLVGEETLPPRYVHLRRRTSAGWQLALCGGSAAGSSGNDRHPNPATRRSSAAPASLIMTLPTTPPGEGTRPTSRTKPPWCRPGALIRRHDLVHKAICCLKHSLRPPRFATACPVATRLPAPYPPLNPLYTPCIPLVIPLYLNTRGIRGVYEGFTGGIQGVSVGMGRWGGFGFSRV